MSNFICVICKNSFLSNIDNRDACFTCLQTPDYKIWKLQHQLEIQTKRVENLKKSNEFYANGGSWVKDYDMSGEMTYFVSIQCRDYEETNNLTKVGGKLARECQAIDRELEKQLEEVK